MADLLEIKDVPVTTADIASAMRANYCQPEWALFFEVSNGTGSNARRHADAVVMNMYPSRGLAIHGFEFKASKSDWKRELAQPQKAEEVARYCDYWSVVTAPGIVGTGELPATWGLLELKGGKLRWKVQPEKNAHLHILDRNFLAAMLRCQARSDENLIYRRVQEETRRIRERAKSDAEAEIERRTAEATKIKSVFPALTEAMTGHRYRYLDEKHFIKCIDMAMNLNLDGEFGGLRHIQARLEDLLKNVTDAASTVNALANPTPKD